MPGLLTHIANGEHVLDPDNGSTGREAGAPLSVFPIIRRRDESRIAAQASSATGSLTRNTLPPSGFGEYSIRPPRDSTICLQT